ncbi:diguanylate cyclase (GGDEF)-like protein [Alteromonadaceae bacterium 2753L.S.0a.02]|nr:diguanylate cyclase (GGDEF)-like protein [Alteromonadaceae bacterium 2753L.S.0a.02]
MKPLLSLLLAMIATAIAILAYDILPLRRLSLIPGDANISLFKDNNGSTAVWLNFDNHHFKCTYSEKQANYKFCGLDIGLGVGEGGLNGVDLSDYESIKLRISYRGAAKVLRVYARQAMRNLPAGVSKDNRMKYNNVFIPVNDLQPELSIQLNEFSVAEWWLRAARMPRELSQVEFSNIVNIGVDAPYPAPNGDHEFVIYELSVLGPYIRRENWYLCVIALWFLVLMARSLKQYQVLRSQVQSKQHLLEDALDRTEHLAEESQHYRELSLIDPLTNIYNRRGITQAGLQIDDSDAEVGVSIVMIDIDFFKRINDLYGHDLGDDILKSVSAVLLACTRNTDRVGRWGGEEFLVICPNTGPKQVLALTEHLLEDIHKITTPDGEHITVSIGVTSSEKFKLDDAIVQADKALYDAKRQGRNRVCVYEALK